MYGTLIIWRITAGNAGAYWWELPERKSACIDKSIQSTGVQATIMESPYLEDINTAHLTQNNEADLPILCNT